MKNPGADKKFFEINDQYLVKRYAVYAELQDRQYNLNNHI